uniref:Uncharacterized protein n=1 Tax=Setaria viridis TaxID=4556 RepID=A0A4U6TJ57_SETVI|nr:hypothetical protein SEVIR_8G162100v2 [Setaria viridis]
MSVPYSPHPTSFHPYSSWGWNDLWAHTPSYFRPYHVKYVAPREPSCSRQSYVEMTVLSKRIDLIYGHKDKSSDLNSISEKLIDMLSTSAINIKDEEKSSIDPPSVKSEPKKLKKLENKKRALLSKIEAKPSHPLGFSNWQKKKLQKLIIPHSCFDPWVPHGSLYHGRLSPNCYAH